MSREPQSLDKGAAMPAAAPHMAQASESSTLLTCPCLASAITRSTVRCTHPARMYPVPHSMTSSLRSAGLTLPSLLDETFQAKLRTARVATAQLQYAPSSQRQAGALLLVTNSGRACKQVEPTPSAPAGVLCSQEVSWSRSSMGRSLGVQLKSLTDRRLTKVAGW